MNEPESEPQNIVLDGDKVVAFIRGVEKLAEILNEINVLGISEAFIKGKTVDCIERVIEISKTWNKAILDVRDATNEEALLLRKCRQAATEQISFLDHAIRAMGSPQFNEGLANLQQFSSLLDNLAKHKDSGLLETVCKLSK